MKRKRKPNNIYNDVKLEITYVKSKEQNNFLFPNKDQRENN